MRDLARARKENPICPNARQCLSYRLPLAPRRLSYEPSDRRRVRLVVRTQPSQGWCTGSTPVRAAIARNPSNTCCLMAHFTDA